MIYTYNKSMAICIYIIQIVTIYNAMMLGWHVKKIGRKKYELSKDVKELQDFDLKCFINDISTI